MVTKVPLINYILFAIGVAAFPTWTSVNLTKPASAPIINLSAFAAATKILLIY